MTTAVPSDLAKRAAVFHGFKDTRALTRQTKRDPEAWSLYVDWHEWHHKPETVTPVDSIASIEFYRLNSRPQP